jgi:hypothetical protein
MIPCLKIPASKSQSCPGRPELTSYSRSAVSEGVTYQCRGPGALLSIPHDGRREDVIRPKVFEDYIRDNVDSWFEWSKKIGVRIERMEDLILVTGCTLVPSWASATFLGRSETAQISLVQLPDKSERSFEFRNIRGDVARHCSRLDPVRFSYFYVCGPCKLTSFITIRKIQARPRINASSSGVSERSAART